MYNSRVISAVAPGRRCLKKGNVGLQHYEDELFVHKTDGVKEGFAALFLSQLLVEHKITLYRIYIKTTEKHVTVL